MDAREKRLLTALVNMVEQYLGRDENDVDSQCMGAGERAIKALEEYGLMVDLNGRSGRWTKAGLDFLETC